MPITNTEALTRVIEHREIFHDEMLALMRRIMSGEMSPLAQRRGPATLQRMFLSRKLTRGQNDRGAWPWRRPRLPV